MHLLINRLINGLWSFAVLFNNSLNIFAITKEIIVVQNFTLWNSQSDDVILLALSRFKTVWSYVLGIFFKTFPSDDRESLWLDLIDHLWQCTKVLGTAFRNKNPCIKIVRGLTAMPLKAISMDWTHLLPCDNSHLLTSTHLILSLMLLSNMYVVILYWK